MGTTPPPPPPRPGAPLTCVDGLAVGDVAMVAKQLTSKVHPYDTYWWRTFRVVLAPEWGGSIRGRYLRSIIAKLNPDLDKDIRTEELGPTFVVTRLEQHQYPQGVAAMLVKLIHLGTVQLDDDVPF